MFEHTANRYMMLECPMPQNLATTAIPDQITTVSSSCNHTDPDKQSHPLPSTKQNQTAALQYDATNTESHNVDGKGQTFEKEATDQQHYATYDGHYKIDGFGNFTSISMNTPNTREAAVPQPPTFTNNNHAPHQVMLPATFQKMPEPIPAERCQPHGKITCSLSNKELWLKFHEHTTEMIITKQGRRMFPTLQFSLKGLKTQMRYAIAMDMVLSSNNQWKYQSGRWIPSGQMDSHSSNATYLYRHPESPNNGGALMKQDLTFAKMKLTNNKSEINGQVVLSSMHKYKPRLIITPQDGLHKSQYFTFSETEFVAVTAYQNTNITQLKIDFNPFAKGFRENSTYNRIEPMSLPSKQTLSKIATDSAETYTQQRHSYSNGTADVFRSGYTGYQGLASCQKSKPASVYPCRTSHYQHSGQPEYYPPTPMPEIQQQAYQPQMGFEQMTPYHNVPYPNWYQGSNVAYKQVSNPAQQPKHYIKDWLRNVEDNAHLQKSFDQIENENNSLNKRVSCTVDEQIAVQHATSHQSPKKRVIWSNYQLMPVEKEQSPLEFYNPQQTCFTPPQPHLMVNGSSQNTSRLAPTMLVTTQSSVKYENNEAKEDESEQS